MNPGKKGGPPCKEEPAKIEVQMAGKVGATLMRLGNSAAGIWVRRVITRRPGDTPSMGCREHSQGRIAAR